MRYLYCVYYKCIDVVCENFYFFDVNSVSRLCLRLRDTALELNLPFDISRWLVEGEDEEVIHEVLVRHHRRLTSHRLLISRPLLRS